MNPLQLKDVVSQLNEVMTLFQTGQRIMPFLNEASGFLQEISPLLEEIDISIQESNHKIPRAASRIHDVSEATEMATNEILDLADEVMDQMDASTRKSNAFVASVRALSQSDEELLVALHEHFGGKPSDALLARIEVLHTRKKEAYAQILADIESENKMQDDIRNKMGKIMMALQVQDITSQQLAAVKHLIDSVRTRMERLSGRIQVANEEAVRKAREVPRHGVVFDVNAEFDRSGARQAAVEDIVNAFNTSKDIEALERKVKEEQDRIDHAIATTYDAGTPAASSSTESASSDDINALFGGDGAASHDSASADDIDALFGGGGQESASSDDINGLFGGSGQETASSDDINTLFGGGDQETASADDIDGLFGGGGQETASLDHINALFGESNGQETASSDDINALFGSGGQETASADEVNALFNGGGQETASADDINALFGGGGQETASADDIEALFGGSNGQETASADDIDKLFGG